MDFVSQSIAPSVKEYLATPEKLEAYRSAFSKYDQGAGVVGKELMGAMMRSAGKDPSEAEVEAAVREVEGEDGTGELTMDKFVDIMSSQEDGASDDDLLQAFRTFDKDGSGFLSADELRDAMTSRGEVMTDEDVDEMLAEADANSDGKINYEEFVQLMSKD